MVSNKCFSHEVSAGLSQPVPTWSDSLPKGASAILSFGADKEKKKRLKKKIEKKRLAI